MIVQLLYPDLRLFYPPTPCYGCEGLPGWTTDLTPPILTSGLPASTNAEKSFPRVNLIGGSCSLCLNGLDRLC